MKISRAELRLLMTALAHRATRLEAIAARQKYGRKHDEQAAAMRKLRVRLFDLQPTDIEEEDQCPTEHSFQ